MVDYCAEQFDNDGSLLSSIVKNLERVMAAEFSRELSAKVHAGQLHLAALGFVAGFYVFRVVHLSGNPIDKAAVRLST